MKLWDKLQKEEVVGKYFVKKVLLKGQVEDSENSEIFFRDF